MYRKFIIQLKGLELGSDMATLTNLLRQIRQEEETQMTCDDAQVPYEIKQNYI
jgi:hypothetical protein